MPSGIYERTEVHNKHISEALEGRIFTQEWIKRKSEATKKYYKEHPEEKIKQSKKLKEEWNSGKRIGGWKLTEEQNRKNSEIHRGENNSNWKDGISLLVQLIRKNRSYKKWRSDVFTRDDFTCQECGKRGGDLEAHHKEAFADILEINDIRTFEQAMGCEELWNINNGITLCEECHNLTKNGRGK